MTPTPDPAQAIADLAAGGLRGGEAEAWRLLTPAWATLERFVRVRLITRDIPARYLEDCGQNVFARVYQFRTGYRGNTERECWCWLGQNCVNERRRLLAREAKWAGRQRVPADGVEAAVAKLKDPEQAADSVLLNEELTALRECLEQLDPRRRSVIEMAYLKPVLPERAIAEVLDCSPANVHKLKAEGLRRLAACLARKGIR